MKRYLSRLGDTTYNFFKRDLKARYADSFLGPLWIIGYPLALTLLATAIFSFVFRGYVAEVPYLLYVLVGFTSWVFFYQSLSAGTKSLLANRELVANNKFPTEAIIVSTILTRLVDYGVNFSLVLLFLTVFRLPLSFENLAFFLIVILSQGLLQLGLTLVAAGLNVYYRDTQNLVEIGLQLLFYATPIVYPLVILPQNLQGLAKANPLAYLLAIERSLLFGQTVETGSLVTIFLFSLTSLLAGLLIFKRLEQKFAELI